MNAFDVRIYAIRRRKDRRRPFEVRWHASTGRPHEPRGLKHHPDGAISIVPIPPALVALLRQHLHDHGTTPYGLLFRGTRTGMLSESAYARTWHTARRDALGPDLAAIPLARRPCQALRPDPVARAG